MRAVLGAFLALVLGTAAAVSAWHAPHPPLPRYGEVPPFTLVDADGQPFGSAKLAGRPAVIDFIFTSCPTTCPRITAEMARLQTWLSGRGLDGRARLVSISIDPERDTPERLRAYAEQFHALPGTWTFLTGGSPAAIEDAVVQGFKIAVGRERDDSVDGFAIVHSAKLVLVDRTLRIRGYYDSGDDERMARLRSDLAALIDGDAP